MESFDAREAGNPQKLAYYAQEICENLQAVETRLLPSAEGLSAQPEVNHKMRAILADWLVSLHVKFKLQQETLYLTTSIIDRYLAKKAISKA